MLQQKIVNQIILDYNPIYAISEESLDVRIIDGVYGLVHTQLFNDTLPNL